MAIRDDFAPGEVLAAADLNDTFAQKVDYALPVNAQTGTTYTFVAADAEKLTTASNAAAVTLTIPPASSVAWPNNTVLRVVNYGAGAVTIAGGSGVTVTNTASTIAQYGAAVAIRTASDAWTVVPFGGGDIPAAEVSSPAATGQYTDGGFTYDYYTFTASGTLTVDTAGFADVLVIGGGGGGGSREGGGGGAGGHLQIANAYLPAGSLTITVGAGGAAPAPPVASTTSLPGNNGNTSRLGSYYSPGGGGGTSPTFRFSDSNIYSTVGLNGGSGGGGSAGYNGGTATGGSGTSGIGSDGGNGVTNNSGAGGGGGASAAGGNGSTNTGGNGGAGLANSYTGSSVTRAGGGGGGGGTAGSGGSGGGGTGGSSLASGTAGDPNTGGGGGGGGANNTGSGSAGGSGVVIVRVKV